MAHTGTALQMKSPQQRSQLLETDELRRRALERLYERMDTVNELIYSLEKYDRAKQPPKCLEFSAARKWS
jgi:SOS response regulatory protein OraA/RecX